MIWLALAKLWREIIIVVLLLAGWGATKYAFNQRDDARAEAEKERVARLIVEAQAKTCDEIVVRQNEGFDAMAKAADDSAKATAVVNEKVDGMLSAMARDRAYRQETDRAFLASLENLPEADRCEAAMAEVMRWYREGARYAQ